MQVLDPVCTMMIDPEEAKFKSEYKGQTYYFCAPGCKYLFDKDPEGYANFTARVQDSFAKASQNV